MAEVTEELVRRGVRVSSVFLTKPRRSRLSELLETAGSEIRYASTSIKLAKILKRSAAGAVVAFGLRPSLTARLVSLLVRPGLHVIDARNGLEHGRRSGLWIVDRMTQMLVHRYVTNSEAVRTDLLAHGISKGRVEVLKSALGREWERQATTLRNPNCVAMIGNNRPEKNHELGLTVATHLAEDIEVRVFTDEASGLRAAWENMRSGEHARVTFVEGHRVTPEEMAGFALLLHTSVSESSPRVLLEAQSQGTPVVATNVGDSLRIVGERGRIVPAGDVAATVAAVNDVLKWGEVHARTPDQTLENYCSSIVRLSGVAL